MTDGLKKLLRVVAWSAMLPLGGMRPFSEDPVENLAAARVTIYWTHAASAVLSAVVGFESTWLATAIGWGTALVSFAYVRRALMKAEAVARESLAKDVMAS